MPRMPRKIEASRPHHLVLRGNNRRRLFSYSTDFKRFLWDLVRATAQFPCAVHAIALMTNHIHLIVTPDEAPALAPFVKSFAQRYAQYRNRRRAASGKLFEERYRSFLIRDEAHLAVATAYVELNPVRAGLVPEPEAYPWTTYALHAGLPESSISRELWVPSAWYLGLGAEQCRAERYRDWIDCVRTRGLSPTEMGTEEALADATASRQDSMRLERPDRTRAMEPESVYGKSARLWPGRK